MKVILTFCIPSINYQETLMHSAVVYVCLGIGRRMHSLWGGRRSDLILWTEA